MQKAGQGQTSERGAMHGGRRMEGVDTFELHSTHIHSPHVNLERETRKSISSG